MATIPAAGYVRNPLHGGEHRNRKCFCTSGKKVKVCCGRWEYIPIESFDICDAYARGDEGAFQIAVVKFKAAQETNKVELENGTKEN